jgi:hypothetical protein
MDRDADVAMDGRPARSEPDLFALSRVLRLGLRYKFCK